MGFLKKIFRNVFRDGMPTHTSSSFEHLSDEELEAHLGVARYGDFVLPGAVRPSYDLQVIPCQGYRHDVYRDEQIEIERAGADGRRLAASRCSRRSWTFSTRWARRSTWCWKRATTARTCGHVDLYREHIDLPVLKSILYDFEELLVNDGCTGIAVLNPSIPQEVQFDEHKLLIVYGQDLDEYEQIFQTHNVRCNDQMKFITEAEHVHSSNESYAAKFEELRHRLAIDAGY